MMGRVPGHEVNSSAAAVLFYTGHTIPRSHQENEQFILVVAKLLILALIWRLVVSE